MNNFGVSAKPSPLGEGGPSKMVDEALRFAFYGPSRMPVPTNA